MSDEIKLGELITGHAERDAVHVALVPLIAGERIAKGKPFKLGSVGTAYSTTYKSDEILGIVDPFLKQGFVKKGEKFWGMLLPNTVTGMRHQWEHPAFDMVCDKMSVDPVDHEGWLIDFARKWNFDYDEMISEASAPTSGTWERWITSFGHDLHSASELGEDHALFWEHLEGLVGERFSDKHKENFGWSCSC